MVSPAILAGGSLVANIVGAGLNYQAAGQQAGSLSRMYQYQSGMALLNKQIALQNKDYAYQVGEDQAQKYGIGAGQRAGAIRAGEGASNIDVGSGSSLDVQRSQRDITKMDLGQIRQNAARVAYGYSTEAVQDEAQAGLYDLASSNALQAGKLKQIASLVGGAASVSDKWLQMGQYGLTNNG